MKVFIRHELLVEQINNHPAHRLDVYNIQGDLLVKGEPNLITQVICVWHNNMRYTGVYIPKEGFVVIVGKMMATFHDGSCGSTYIETKE